MVSSRFYSILTIGFVVGFAGFVGAVSMWSGPQEADALSLSGHAERSGTQPAGARPDATTPAAAEGDPLNTPTLSLAQTVPAEASDNTTLASTDSQDQQWYAMLERLVSANNEQQPSSYPPSSIAYTPSSPSMSYTGTDSGWQSSPAASTGSPIDGASSSESSAGTTEGSSTAPSTGDTTTPSTGQTGSGPGGNYIPPDSPSTQPTHDAAREAMLIKLRDLKPLPKVHYPWWLHPDFLKDPENDELLYQLARTSHALGISGEWACYEQVEAVVAACAKVNKTNPAIPATIAVSYMPWHREFRQDLPRVIPAQYNHTIFNHPSYHAEIERYERRMNLVKEWVSQSNAKLGANVQIDALLLDCERFYSRNHDPAWNQAMGNAQNDIHQRSVQMFPDARIEWYNRGMGGRRGTLMRPYLVDNLIMTGMSCSLYSVPFIKETRAFYNGTRQLADTYVINGQTPWEGLSVTPWVGLNFGFDWALWDAGVRPERECLRMPWEYPLSLSYQIGAELNSFKPPYDRTEVIVIYPAPFNSRLPNWGWHYIEYLKGAAAAK